MHDPHPTFDRCRCGGMIHTDGTRFWCPECEWSAEQGRLFDDCEQNDTDS